MYTPKAYRGFESRPLRHDSRLAGKVCADTRDEMLGGVRTRDVVIGRVRQNRRERFWTARSAGREAASPMDGASNPALSARYSAQAVDLKGEWQIPLLPVPQSIPQCIAIQAGFSASWGLSGGGPEGRPPPTSPACPYRPPSKPESSPVYKLIDRPRGLGIR